MAVSSSPGLVSMKNRHFLTLNFIHFFLDAYASLYGQMVVFLRLSPATVGVLGALALTQLLTSLLYGVGAKDPVTFSTVPMMLLAVAFLACSVPALVATRIDPIRALHYE